MMVYEIEDSNNGKKLLATVTFTSRGIGIGFNGYGDKTSEDGEGEVIFVDVEGGNPMVRVWGDINEEDPTHTITLEGAKESDRKEG